jgi:hypothetical protein
MLAMWQQGVALSELRATQVTDLRTA